MSSFVHTIKRGDRENGQAGKSREEKVEAGVLEITYHRLKSNSLVVYIWRRYILSLEQIKRNYNIKYFDEAKERIRERVK